MESNGSERVSGVWIGARKLGGELDVGGRRIIRLIGESMSRCGTSRAKDKCEGRSAKCEVRILHCEVHPFPSTCVMAGREYDTLAGVGRFHCSLT